MDYALNIGDINHKELCDVDEISYTSDWIRGRQSEIIIDNASLGKFNHDQHLQLLSQSNAVSETPAIPATTIQKLFFYQTYTSSLSKTHVSVRGRHEFNIFVWLYIFNTLCKSLPSIYVYMFFASYAPDYHFFIPKLLPIMHGCKWAFIFIAIFDLLSMADYVVLFLDYVICGLFYKVPWNRCNYDEIMNEFGEVNYNCTAIDQFKNRFLNTSIIKYQMTYFSTTSREHFNLIQFIYYYHRMLFWSSQKGVYIKLAIFALICLFNVTPFSKLTKEYIWKTLSKTHIALNIMLLLILMHCTINYVTPNIAKMELAFKSLQQMYMISDHNLIAESMTAPPVVHILSAKGCRQIYPARDSVVMVLSNGINYIIKYMTTGLLRTFCENYVNAPLYFFENIGIDQQFTLYPIYFAIIDLGDIYVVIFFILNFFVESCTLIITCQCLIEAIICDRNLIKPYHVQLLIFISCAFAKIVCERTFLYAAHMYAKVLCTLLEAVVIYWVYPVGRLGDDIEFHTGHPPTRLMVVSFKLVPLYYLFKLYLMFSNVDLKQFVRKIKSSEWIFFTLPLTPIFIGALYSIYYYIIKKRTSWSQLFKPVPEWGPGDFNTRNLRKQFDSRNYIESQAPRELSRHLISMAQSKVYKLDIRYNITDRTSQISDNNVYYKDEKKQT